MLALDDARWASLTHAYGSAADVPRLIGLLAKDASPKPGYDCEPWFSIWSGLCHQDDVFDASYAAVPHILDIACRTDGPIDFSFFQLPAAVEIARQAGRGPDLPSDLADAYFRALERIEEAIAKHRTHDWDEAMLLSVLAAQSVAKGHIKVATALMNLDDDLIQRLIVLDFDG